MCVYRKRKFESERDREHNMGTNLPKFNLDLNSSPLSNTISEILREISMMDDISEKSLKLNDYVHMLEEEMKRIDGFKSQLPLCMLLLNNAIMKLKEEKMQFPETEVSSVPVLVEFLPLKPNSDEGEEAKIPTDCSYKMNWMSSAQLWTSNNFDINNRDLEDKEEDRSTIKNSNQLSDIDNKGGAFVPFTEQLNLEIKENKDKEALQVDSSFSTPMAEMGFIDLNYTIGDNSVTNQTKSLKQKKKHRRCWSPELHRRFVEAIQYIGGIQVATPKHIRELMQVDGLTNDEVKSHLQKYRLHVQKFPASFAATPHGLWLAQHQYALLKANIAQSSSPLEPFPFAGSGNRVFFAGCTSMEDEEDEKSNSYSWKGGRMLL